MTVDCTVLCQSWSRNGGPTASEMDSDQNSDVVRYEEFLAEDFTAT
jgi:hypothetical protein